MRPRPASRFPSAKTTRRLQKRFRPSVEALEDRTVPSAVAPPSGMVAWWTADNSGVDLIGGNNAALFNGAGYAAGKVAEAFNFDGVNDRVQVADADSLKLTASMTIEAWIRVDSFTGGVILFRGDDRGGLDPYNLSFDSSGQLQFAISTNTNASTVIKASVPLGEFIHVAATLDDATGAMKLYLNGTVAAQTITTIRPFRDLDPASNPSIGIGNHGGYPSSPHNFPFDGLIDELSVYNRALTANEIQGIVTAGSDGKIKSPNYIAADFPSVVEGPAGSTSSVTFTISRVGSLAGDATVDWTTANGTATSGTDFVAASGQLLFADGESQKTVQVMVNGDSAVETNETFELVLSTTTPGYAVGGGQATIIEDDVGVSISDGSAIEGSKALKILDRFASDGGIGRPRGSVFGPDANADGAADFYLASADTNQILRYDGHTGAFLDVFIGAGSGGLNSPLDLAFAPDGTVYVSSYGSGEVLRYDGMTGSFLNAIASGLSEVHGLSVGGDGAVYIAVQGTDEILRYDASGLSVFVAPGSGGIDRPRHSVFGPDRNGDSEEDLYVANAGSGGRILVYDGVNGDFISLFAQSPPGAPGSFPNQGLAWLEFGSDGYIYATARTTSTGLETSIVRFSATTGAFVDSFQLRRDGWSFSIGSDGFIYDSANASGSFVDRVGASSWAAFTVSLSVPSSVPVTVDFSSSSGTALAGSDYVGSSGTLTFAPGQTTRTILIQTSDDATIELNETFSVEVSNPTGAAIVDGSGTGTIVDNDTKFYVINDATTNLTYEYGAGTGMPGESYSLGAANTAPRGAASTAAGDKVWVLDANKTVYVYNAAGGLLGSWTAGSLQPTAQVEGIATNGTDIWIVDAKQDKVFKYTGAASLLSGSQNAASSFNLNSGNKNPKGIVTDSVHLWVVNDSTTDKVFKYTLTGALVGSSWTILGGGGAPTGITLDPSNVAHLWIVDNGTDRGYQYDNAAGVTSGSLGSSTSFLLAAGNTNPQDIADPPVTNTSTTAIDYGNDGTIDSRQTSVDTLDPHGNLVSQVLSFDSNADGISDSSSTLTQMLDPRGRWLGLTTTYDFEDDGTPDYSDSFAQSFDNHGNLLASLWTTDSNGDGIADYSDGLTQSFDHHGNLLASLSTTDWNGDGIADHSDSITQTFDKQGNRIARQQSIDFDGDGVPNYAFSETRTFQRQGEVWLAEGDSTYDWNGDGTADLVIGAVETYGNHNQLIAGVYTTDYDLDGIANSIETLTQSFDRHGNLISSARVFDWNADGSAESVLHLTQSFDVHGQLLTSVQSADLNADGVTDAIEASVTQSFDQRGNLLAWVQTYDWNRDGVTDYFESVNQGFDGRGNLLSWEFLASIDWNSDGVADVTSRAQQSLSFDQHGNLLASVYAADWNDDGLTDYSSTLNQLFDQRGNLLTSVLAEDWTGDGVTDYESRVTNTYDRDGALLSTVAWDDWDGDGLWDLLTTAYTTTRGVKQG